MAIYSYGTHCEKTHLYILLKYLVVQCGVKQNCKITVAIRIT